MLRPEFVKTPSPHEESEFTIPQEHSSVNITNWKRDVDNWNYIAKKAFNFIIKKHQNKGGIISLYDLCFDDQTKELFPVNSKEDEVDPKKAQLYWLKLMTDIKVKIIFIYLVINFEDSGHANLIIIDKTRKEIEFFEPNGSNWSKNQTNTIIARTFDQMFMCESNDIDTFCFIPQTYICSNYALSCPLLGFQSWESKYGGLKSKDNKGFCMFWTIFFLELRLNNLSYGVQHIQREYLNILKEQLGEDKEVGKFLRKFIIDYSNFWGENFARRNPRRSVRN